jgi:hypothetical protein
VQIDSKILANKERKQNEMSNDYDLPNKNGG